MKQELSRKKILELLRLKLKIGSFEYFVKTKVTGKWVVKDLVVRDSLNLEKAIMFLILFEKNRKEKVIEIKYSLLNFSAPKEYHHLFENTIKEIIEEMFNSFLRESFLSVKIVINDKSDQSYYFENVLRFKKSKYLSSLQNYSNKYFTKKIVLTKTLFNV